MKPGRPPLHPIPDDCSLDVLERCWLSAHNEADARRSECRLLEQVFRAVEADWREAQARLTQSEALRDALATECLALRGAGIADPDTVPATWQRTSVA